MTITEFLLARIAEDEAIASAATEPERPGTHWQWVTSETDTPVAPGELAEAQEHQEVSLRSVEEFPTSAGALPFFTEVGGYVHPGAGEHITRHDPARVLAECKAKRAIMEMHGSVHDVGWKSGEANDYLWCGSCGSIDDAPEPFPCATLKALAVVYADHLDYDQAWATA